MLLNENIIGKPLLETKEQVKLPDGVLCRVTYPICNINQRNANNRVYERAVWDKVLEDKDLQHKLESRSLFGHAEHPEQTASDLGLTSHVIHKMWIDEDKNVCYQTLDVLDTPAGRIVDTLLKAGCQCGVSTRAEGDLEECEDDQGKFQKVISEKYKYVTTDFTADPSTYDVMPLNVKRNVVSETKKELERKDLKEDERKYMNEMLNSMKCKNEKCLGCGACNKVNENQVVIVATPQTGDVAVTGDVKRVALINPNPNATDQTIEVMIQTNPAPLISEPAPAEPKEVPVDLEDEIEEPEEIESEVPEETEEEVEESKDTTKKEELNFLKKMKVRQLEFKKEKEEHPEFTDEQIWQIVFDHMKEFKIKEDLDVPERHQYKRAKKTLRLSDEGAHIMGGMTKEQARVFLKKQGWSDKRIADLEESKEMSSNEVLMDAIESYVSDNHEVNFKDIQKKFGKEAEEIVNKLVDMKRLSSRVDDKGIKILSLVVEESKIDETENINKMYQAAGLPVPDGKGIHTEAFHKLAIEVAKGYVKSGDTPEEALKKAYPTAMKQLGKEKAVKKEHQSESQEVNSVLKDVTELKIKEAITRAEKDAIVEAFVSDKDSILEIKMLTSRLHKSLVEKNVSSTDISSLCLVLEKKAEQIKSLSNEIIEANKVKEELVKVNVELIEAKNKIDVVKVEGDAAAKVLKSNIDSANIIIKEVKANCQQLVKEYIDLKLKSSRLMADTNTRALLESSTSLQQVDAKFDELLDVARVSALHSNEVTEVIISKSMDSKTKQLSDTMGSVFESMGYKIN
jgi:hypothetical protein